jgi:hypothetical protein
MEQCQPSLEGVKKYKALAEVQMETKAKIRGLLALMNTTTNGRKRMEFVNRDFNATINIRRCAVMDKRPPEMTREIFAGQHLKVRLYEKKMEPVVGGQSKNTGRRLHVIRTCLV